MDLIDRRDVLDLPRNITKNFFGEVIEETINVEDIKALPSKQSEVIPHRNYERLSCYWCECGWYLGRKHDVKYCADCGRKVKWDEAN